MLAALERKRSLAMRRAAVWAASDNEGARCLSVALSLREVISRRVCV